MKEENVSVIVPCYNASATIERAIKSVINQTIRPIEVLVYDDYSNDNSVAVIEKLNEVYGGIKLIRSVQNNGAGVARATLLKKAVGNYIAFLDADDWWHEEKIERQLDSMRKTDADICVTGYKILRQDGSEISQRIPPKKITYRMMLLSNWIPMSTSMIKSNLIGISDMPAIRKRQDYAYWLAIMSRNPSAKCVTIPEILGYYQKSDNSLSSNKIDNIKYNYFMFRSCVKFGVTRSIILVIFNILFRAMRK